MYQAYLATGAPASIYFIVMVLMGKIIMLNLFLAIMLGNFEQASMDIRSENEDAKIKQFEE